jgi:hypothetical protein
MNLLMRGETEQNGEDAGQFRTGGRDVRSVNGRGLGLIWMAGRSRMVNIFSRAEKHAKHWNLPSLS